LRQTAARFGEACGCVWRGSKLGFRQVRKQLCGGAKTTARGFAVEKLRLRGFFAGFGLFVYLIMGMKNQPSLKVLQKFTKEYTTY